MVRWSANEIWARDRAWLHANDGAQAGDRPGIPVERIDDDEFGNMDDDEEMPQINDLIPENDGGRRRPRDEGDQGGRAVVPRGDDMGDVAGRGAPPRGPGNDGELVEAARAAAPGGGPTGVSKETPISQYPSVSYGLQETHTTILPYRVWFSGGNLDHAGPLQVEFRMNAIWDMLKTSVEGATGGTALPTKAIYNMPVGPGSMPIANVFFPQTPVNGATERPQWRDYWANFYQYYTVLGCKWKATINNSGNARGADLVVGVQYDSYSDTVGTVGNIMPKSKFAETLAFKNIQWTSVPCGTSEQDGENSRVISGTYKPGMIARNIQNDGDVKTWTATSNTLPALKEILTLNFFKDSLNYTTGLNTSFNCCVELDYIVQFKDLREQARYPNSTTTDQDIGVIISDTNGVGWDSVRYQQSVV